MKHIDDFFQTQSLLIWQPGAMGAFLMNFLDAGLPNYKTKLTLEKLGMLENKEWQYSDYFITYYNYSFPTEYPEAFNEITRIKKIVSYTYGEENVEKYTSYLVAMLCHRVVYKSNRLISLRVFNEILPVLKHIKTVNDLNLYLNLPFDNQYHYYVKLHPFHTIDSSIPWKEKILCYFPPEKNWMKFLLQFYKLCFYDTLKLNRPYFNDNLPFEKIITRFLNNEFVGLEYADPNFDVYTKVDKEDLIHVDMYDFLFNDGYKKLITTMTPEQEKVLQKGKDSTLEILDFFKISHNLELPANSCINTIPEFETFRELVRKHYK